MNSLPRMAWVSALIVMSSVQVSAAPAPLADAAQRNDAAAVETLLKQGADPAAAQPDGSTALHWAVYLENVDLSRQLLQKGADPRASTDYAVTPIHLAALNGNDALLRLLLEAGADPNTSAPGGEPTLHTAARAGRPGPVATLLEHGAHIDARESNGQTALMWAAAEGHAEVVQTLIDAGANFKTPLPSGFTPLLFAARNGKVRVVKTLLAAGADVNEVIEPTGRGGRSPARRGSSPLILAVENGHFELAARLVEMGADPNDLRSGYSPLHTLTWVRKPGRGDDGDPAPIGSGNMSSLQLVRHLVAHGADVNRPLDRGRRARGGQFGMLGATPFLLACRTGDVAYIHLLLELGADPHLANADGSTALMAAAGLGCTAPGEEAGTEEEALALCTLLLDLGANPNAVDQNGETAMHGAAYKSFPRVAAFLAQRGADITVWNSKNVHGWTPLLIAEGYRPGNFKPAPEAIETILGIMLAQGVTPPDEPKPRLKNYED